MRAAESMLKRPWSRRPLGKKFADTEALIAAGEKLFGPYRWQRFDLVVMSPGFGSAATENPRLAFISPDSDCRRQEPEWRSLRAHWRIPGLENSRHQCDLAATSGSARASALYLGDRLMSAVYGGERASMEAVLGLNSLREESAQCSPKDQVLAVDLRGRDPQTACASRPASEKGRLFLSYLDALNSDANDSMRSCAAISITSAFKHQHRGVQPISTGESARPLPGIVGPQQVLAWENTPGIPAGGRVAGLECAVRRWMMKRAWRGWQ